MIRYRVTHSTVYRYEAPVSSSYGQVCLLPRATAAQLPIEAGYEVDPQPCYRHDRTDYFGNRLGFFHLEDFHDVLTITAESLVEVNSEWIVSPGVGGPTLASARAAVRALDSDERMEASMHLLDSTRVPIDEAIRDYAAPSFVDDRPAVDCLADLVSRINGDFQFSAQATDATSTVDDLFRAGGGVCQDFAHLAVGCVRAAGLPARYVSGYLETDPPPGSPKLIGADASHAWASVLIPGRGWIDIDPTNDQFVNDRYVTVAWGRDYADVAPVKGVIFANSGATALEVAVDVVRVA